MFSENGFVTGEGELTSELIELVDILGRRLHLIEGGEAHRLRFGFRNVH
jgi:hypothetical protein